MRGRLHELTFVRKSRWYWSNSMLCLDASRRAWCVRADCTIAPHTQNTIARPPELADLHGVRPLCDGRIHGCYIHALHSNCIARTRRWCGPDHLLFAMRAAGHWRFVATKGARIVEDHRMDSDDESFEAELLAAMEQCEPQSQQQHSMSTRDKRPHTSGPAPPADLLPVGRNVQAFMREARAEAIARARQLHSQLQQARPVSPPAPQAAPSVAMGKRKLDDCPPTNGLTVQPGLGRSVLNCGSLDAAAAALLAATTGAVLVQRPFEDGLRRAFADYVASCPQWPYAEERHPLEASWDRVAVVDFLDKESSLEGAVGYGRGLPPRNSADRASVDDALTEVIRPLPEALAAIVRRDAADTLRALRQHTGSLQFLVRLEFVVGDTCPSWHCDHNISRTLITYAGPGTMCAHEYGVARSSPGIVQGVSESAAVQAATGDFLLMKGGKWPGSDGRGAAHRAPPIGAVGGCEPKHFRLLLKVDVLDDDGFRPDLLQRVDLRACTQSGFERASASRA